MTLETLPIPSQQLLTLQTIAHDMGKTLDELVREVLEQFIRQFQQRQQLTLLRQARGMWVNRTDLPDLSLLRAEFEREAIPDESKIVT